MDIYDKIFCGMIWVLMPIFIFLLATMIISQLMK